MEDGPEAAEGTYELDGRSYRLEERDSEVWSVLDGEKLLGELVAEEIVGESGPRYTVRFPGDKQPEAEFVDEWQSALDYLINESLS